MAKVYIALVDRLTYGWPWVKILMRGDERRGKLLALTQIGVDRLRERAHYSSALILIRGEKFVMCRQCDTAKGKMSE